MSSRPEVRTIGACLIATLFFLSSATVALGQAAVPVSLPNTTAVRGESITIPVTIGDLTGRGVSDYTFTLNYDATKLTPVGGLSCSTTCYDTAGTISSAMSIAANATVSGKVTIAAFQALALSGSGTLINLKFTVNSSASGVGALTWQSFSANEGALSVTLTGGSVTIPAFQKPVVDFNGDGKTDYAVTRDASGSKMWWLLTNGSNAVSGPAWGLSNLDRETPADFDGDGKADVAVWRPSSSGSMYYIIRSSDSTLQTDNFGLLGDDPSVTADYDGDGKADPAVFRCPTPTAGQCYFFYRGSNNNAARNITYIPWGYGVARSTIFPVSGDFDGDGKYDFCVKVDGGGGNGLFILRKSSNSGIEYVQYGLASDQVIPRMDYDGDGRTDFAVARLNGSNYNLYILTRSGGGTGAAPIYWGVDGDNAAFGDYDGDGKTDVGVWRPSNGVFYIIKSSDSSFLGFQWGRSGDTPVAEWVFPSMD